MKVIDLLNKIANGEEVPSKIHYGFDDYKLINYDGKTKFYQCLTEPYKVFNVKTDCLNDEVEILEEENELHANNIEFNINNDKRDCIITLDENDLGIDKLHLDNCSFNKENGKWYVKKYDFKTIKLEEEKKIPEKIPSNYTDDRKPEEVYEYLRCSYNQLIDYLKSKGDE